MSNNITDSCMSAASIYDHRKAYLIKFCWSWFERLFQNLWGQSKSIAVTSDSEWTAPPWAAVRLQSVKFSVHTHGPLLVGILNVWHWGQVDLLNCGQVVWTRSLITECHMAITFKVGWHMPQFNDGGVSGKTSLLTDRHSGSVNLFSFQRSPGINKCEKHTGSCCYIRPDQNYP